MHHLAFDVEDAVLGLDRHGRMGVASGRRIVFTKSRMREAAEVERARRALARCMAEEHTVEGDDD